jgi:ribonuclease HI
MAIWAAIHGLKALTVPCWVRFYSSTSAYFIRANNGSWVDAWKRHNWVNDPLGGRPHHVDLWKKFMSWKDLHDIIFTHVDELEYFPEIQRAEQLSRVAMKQADLPVDVGFQDPENQGDPMEDFDPHPQLCPHCSTPLVPKESRRQDPFELFSTDYYFSCPGCQMTYLVPGNMKMGYFFYDGRLI